MTPIAIAGLCAVMVGTSFLSGIFGMAGGMILMGVLLVMMPVAAAMALHAVTQMAANGWRAVLLRRHIRWSAVAFYLVGAGLALGVWSIWRYVPSAPLAMIFLGLSPFVVRLAPADLRPNPLNVGHGAACGVVCMSLMLMTGVSGPLLDTFFLGGKLDRREVVATKATCQVLSHGIKLLYFGAIVAETGSVDPLLGALAVIASIVGTTLGKQVLERMNDAQFRRWSGWVIMTIASVYLARGTWLLATA